MSEEKNKAINFLNITFEIILQIKSLHQILKKKAKPKKSFFYNFFYNGFYFFFHNLLC